MRLEGEAEKHRDATAAALKKMDELSDDINWSGNYRLGVAFAMQILTEQLEVVENA